MQPCTFGPLTELEPKDRRGLRAAVFQRGQHGKRVRVIFESRGKVEDAALELEFRRIMDTTRMRGMSDTLDFMIVSKQCNSAGLQIADMVARPIGFHVVRSSGGEMRGYGLKIYP